MKKELIAWISLVATLILAIIKTIAGYITNSASVLAEGIHSSMDVISSIITIFGIKKAKKPVDKKHPYGHYKFEVFSGFLITILLFIAGLWIVIEAIQNIINPETLELTHIGLMVMALSTIVNYILSKAKIIIGKKENSISLVSDGVHSRVDVYVSIAVFLGLILNPFWMYADSTLALLVGLFIIKESFELGKEATDSLLDVSAGEEVENKIKEILKKNKIKLSDLKTLKRGSAITANLKIKLPSNLSVKEATEITNKIRKKLINKIKNLQYVAIQIESHDIETNYYQPKEWYNKGFGWERMARFTNQIKGAKGSGPGGYCVCPKCGYKIKHERGIPCAKLKCPKCGIPLARED